MLMDRAYEGDEIRQLVLELRMVPVVSPKSHRVDPWATIVLSAKSAMKLNACSAPRRGIALAFIVEALAQGVRRADREPVVIASDGNNA